MNTYVIILFLHILSATSLVGGSIVAAPLIRAGARRARTYEELRASLSLGAPLRFINPMAALGLMATGVYLATLLHWWGLGWVQVALTAWVVNVLVAARVVGPLVGRLAIETIDRYGPVSDATDRIRRSMRWTLASNVLIANDAAVLLLMVLKLPLASSIVVVALAHALLLGALGLGAAWQAHAPRRSVALQH